MNILIWLFNYRFFFFHHLFIRDWETAYTLLTAEDKDFARNNGTTDASGSKNAEGKSYILLNSELGGNSLLLGKNTLSKSAEYYFRRQGGEGSCEQLGPVSVVYTKESQTADAFIERTTYEISDEHSVRVVTSDYQEQLVILGSGGLRVSAREFYAEILETTRLIRETIESYVK